MASRYMVLVKNDASNLGTNRVSAVQRAVAAVAGRMMSGANWSASAPAKRESPARHRFRGWRLGSHVVAALICESEPGRGAAI